MTDPTGSGWEIRHVLLRQRLAELARVVECAAWREGMREALALLGSLEDATRDLFDSEGKYRTLFDHAPIGLGVADEAGNILAFNEAMLVPGGWTRAAIEKVGNVGALYYDPGERDAVLALAHRQGFLSRHEVRFRRQDGGWRRSAG
jgi:PAS domain S-box-containing protein